MAARVVPLSKIDGTPTGSQIRPITVLCQVYRAWATLICKQVLCQWGTVCPKAVTGMLPSRGAHRAAYDMQAKLEFAHFQQKKVCGMVFDLVKCFNHINQPVAIRLLLKMNIPEHLVRQFQGSITQLQRYWQVCGDTIGPINATVGFPEGDPFSVAIMVSIATCWTCFVGKKWNIELTRRLMPITGPSAACALLHKLKPCEQLWDFFRFLAFSLISLKRGFGPSIVLLLRG